MAGAGRQGPGRNFTSGEIESIDGNMAIFRCHDGVIRQVRADVMLAKGAAPEVGETWMIDYKYGHWILGAIIGWDGQNSTGAGLEGPPGPTGPAGPPGPPGPAGSGTGGGGEYVHSQMVAATTWSITHNLGTYPAVVVIDSAGTEQSGDVTYTDMNHLTIHFTGAFAGTATLIG